MSVNNFHSASMLWGFPGGTMMKLILSLFCFGFMILVIQLAFPENKNIMERVYPGAFDIQKKTVEQEQMQFIYYKVKEDYPSVKVYHFYSKILKNQNYQEMDWKDQHLGVWYSFIDGTLKNSPVVYEFRAIWADKNKKEMFVLSLRYYSKSGLKQDKPDNNILHVYFQKRPFLRLQVIKDGEG